MSTTLDRRLDHYVEAVLAGLQHADDKTGDHARVEFDGQTLHASAHTREAARVMLSHKLRRRIFDAMNRSHPLPTVNGIDINPGSC